MSSCRLYRVLVRSVTLSCLEKDVARRIGRATEAAGAWGPLAVAGQCCQDGHGFPGRDWAAEVRHCTAEQNLGAATGSGVLMQEGDGELGVQCSDSGNCVLHDRVGREGYGDRAAAEHR